MTVGVKREGGGQLGRDGRGQRSGAKGRGYDAHLTAKRCFGQPKKIFFLLTVECWKKIFIFFLSFFPDEEKKKDFILLQSQ